MKWGRHRSSSSRLSSLSHVFPTSWLSKFKQMSIKTQPQLAKSKRKTIPKSPSLSSPMPLVFRGNRLYGEDPSFSPEVLDGRMGRSNSRLSEIDGDDAFWRLSFGDESVEGKKSRSMLKSVWFDSDDELDFPSPGYQGCRLTTTEVVEKEEIQFSDMISDTRKIRELPPNVEILRGNETCKGVEGLDETEFETPRRKIVKNGRVSDGKSKKGDQRIVEEQSSVSHRELTKAKQKSTNSVQEVELELEPATMQATKDTNHSLIAPRYISTSNSRDTNADLKEIDRVFVEKSNSEQKTDIDIKIKELLSKRERQRKSPHVNRELQRRKKQSCKVRVYSPRTASKIENCKIRALEDAKNTKMKRKKRDKAVEGRTSLESFAVVKCSFNPQKDFRDSMEEMIAEKRIRQPEELEELLACYLSLNSDEYHDLIIEAFRQVWFELNQDCFSPELEKDHSMYDCSQST